MTRTTDKPNGPAAVLTEVADAAERIIAELAGGTAANARCEAKRLNILAHGETGPAAGVDPRILAALTSRTTSVAGLASRRSSALAIAEAANSVRRLVADQAGVFEDPAARALLALGYLEREAQLRSIAGQRRAVRAAIDQAVATWPALRHRALAGGGEELAQRFDAHLERLSRHEGAADVENETGRGVELVALMRGIVLGHNPEDGSATGLLPDALTASAA